MTKKKAGVHKLSVTGVLPVVVLIMLNINCIHGIDFHRKTTGVTFSAYVHNNISANTVSEWTSYSLQDVKTMMKVMAGRFSNISTFGVGAGAVQESYTPNQTYYRSYSQVFAGEAAAMVNKEMPVEMAKEKALRVYLGIWLHSNEEQLETEVKLALESADKANSIYHETVQGWILSHSTLSYDENVAKSALETVHELQKGNIELKLKLGTRQNCEELKPKEPQEEINKYHNSIIEMTNFTICEVNPELSLGPVDAFAEVKTKLLAYKNYLQAINPKHQVMGQTGWPANFSRSQEVDAMTKYWKLVDDWAAKENITMWMLEAFDNPWKQQEPSQAHFGWWKLTQDSKTGIEQGYMEKVKGNSAQGQTGSSTSAPKGTSKPTPPPQTTKKSPVTDPRSANGKKHNGAAGSGNYAGIVAGVLVVAFSIKAVIL